MAANKRTARPRQGFGQLSQRSRDRIAAEGAKYGMSRRQTRDRYNRGTFNPLSPKPEKHKPRNPENYPGPELTNLSIEDLRDRATARIRALVGDTIQYNGPNVKDALEQTSDRKVMYRLIFATESELEDLASLQPQRRAKDRHRLQSMGMLWTDDHGNKRSFFWYH